ncbi:MAG: tripartite tricarboxylate transporter substrate binding protein [Betaproteobacteria bacterium]
MRRLVWALIAALALTATTGRAEYPDKPIRIIVPFPPGAFNDQLARVLGQRFTQHWGQPVIVDNRPGGATVIGTDLAAKSAPDGYTLLIVSFAFAVNPSLQSRLPFDTVKDFAPIALAATTPNFLVVRPTLPAKSVQELLTLARSKPASLNYASAGNGTSNHLSMELFKSMAGVDLVHVPYKGSAPAVADLLGGKVDVMFDNAPNVLPQVKAGKLRALAVSSSKRSKTVPELPTVAESSVPDFDVQVWFGVVAPTGTPRSIVDKLNAEINRILQTPEVKSTFERQGVDVAGGTPEQFAAHLRTQMAKWAKVVKDTGAHLD